jgi:hypothetical protein
MGKFKTQKLKKTVVLKLRILIMNNFCSTTFQNFECGWPHLGLKGRKKAKKVEIFHYFGDFFKSRSPKVECLLTRLAKPDKKK